MRALGGPRTHAECTRVCGEIGWCDGDKPLICGKWHGPRSWLDGEIITQHLPWSGEGCMPKPSDQCPCQNAQLMVVKHRANQHTVIFRSSRSGARLSVMMAPAEAVNRSQVFALASARCYNVDVRSIRARQQHEQWCDTGRKLLRKIERAFQWSRRRWWVSESHIWKNADLFVVFVLTVPADIVAVYEATAARLFTIGGSHM